jgi:hypothetical protein
MFFLLKTGQNKKVADIPTIGSSLPRIGGAEA